MHLEVQVSYYKHIKLLLHERKYMWNLCCAHYQLFTIYLGFLKSIMTFSKITAFCLLGYQPINFKLHYNAVVVVHWKKLCYNGTCYIYATVVQIGQNP